MFRTARLKLNGNIGPLVETASLYNQACQAALDYGFKNKTFNKNRLHEGTYHSIRNIIPALPSGLVQCARDQAAGLLKREKCQRLPVRKRLQMKYDVRIFTLFLNKGYVSLSTANRRQKFRVVIYDHCRKYLAYKHNNAQLVIRRGVAYLHVQCEMPDIGQVQGTRILGIDRGILNIATCSDNSFVNSRHLRNVKGRYRFLRTRLQSLGTRSAKRKLASLSGRERRFVLNVNHVVSKKIIEKPYDVYSVEALRVGGRRSNSKKFNQLLGGWSHAQLLRFLKYKAENIGKTVIEVSPKYTSQKCSKCGHIHIRNRTGSKFKCLDCGFELNSDLNAARNISLSGITGLGRLRVNQPIVAQRAVRSLQK